MTITLGRLSLESPFVMAPMAGITDSPFRRVLRRRQCPLLFSELISAKGIKYHCPETCSMLRFHQEERPIGVQLFGAEVEELSYAAGYVEQIGVDFIDLNLGCSVPKIIKKGAGAALARDLPRLEKALTGMVQAVKIPVSIKLRSGWDTESILAPQIARIAANSGISWVTVHGRTSEQHYSGKADWQLIAKIKESLPIAVIGNGDLATAQQIIDHWRSYGVDAVMIGRSAMRNPFIFRQALALWQGKPDFSPTSQDFLKLIEEHSSFLYDYYPPAKALLHLRKFLVWYSTSHSGCRSFRQRIFSIYDQDLLWQETQEFFSDKKGDRLDSNDHDHICNGSSISDG